MATSPVDLRIDDSPSPADSGGIRIDDTPAPAPAPQQSASAPPPPTTLPAPSARPDLSSGALDRGASPKGVVTQQTAPQKPDPNDLATSVNLAIGVAAGHAGTWTPQKSAQLASASPNVQDFAKTAGFFFPNAISKLSAPQPGTNGSSAPALSGKPGMMGSQPVSPSMAPQAPPALPSASEITAGEQSSAAIHALTQEQALTEAAKAQAMGIPPAQPAKPPMPTGMDQNVVTRQTMQTAAKAVQLAPPEARAGMMLDAHKSLTSWIAKQGGTFVGPDGMIHSVDSPKKAGALAEKFINDTVQEHQDAIQQAQDAQQKRSQDIAKQQEQAQKDAVKEAEQAKKEADKQKEAGIDTSPEMRAKTILDSNSEVTGADRQNLVKQRLGVDSATADRLIQGYDNPSAPTVGGDGHEVPEEPPATIDAQVKALQNGTTHVVMLPEGTSYKPPTPPGMKHVKVAGDAPGAGTYIYNPNAIDADTIKEAAKAGTHGDLLGHIMPKEQVEQGAQPVIVTARDPKTGVAIQDSAVDAARPGAVEVQSQVLQQRHPGAAIEAKPANQVIADRAQDHAQQTGVTDTDHYNTALEQVAPGKNLSDLSPEQQSEVISRAQEMKEASGGKDVFDQVQNESLAKKSDGNEAQNPAENISLNDVAKREAEHKYSFGSTQHTITDPATNASIDHLRDRISGEDLAGDGKDIDANHVTVRYGIKGGDNAGIKDFLSKQSPFYAKLGPTDAFPPSENSNGAAPVIAPVESDGLRKLNADIEKHGDFKESDFPDYKPHVTVAYVKPEAAEKYKGMPAEGNPFLVDHVDISDRDGNKERVKLGGQTLSNPNAKEETKVPERAEPESIPASSKPIAKGDRISITDKRGIQRAGTVSFAGDRVTRLRGDDGREYTAPNKSVSRH